MPANSRWDLIRRLRVNKEGHIDTFSNTVEPCVLYVGGDTAVKKVKLSLFTHTKAYRRCRATAPLILNLGTTWRWSTSSPCRLTPRKEPRYPPKKWLGGPQSRSGRCGEQKNILPLPGLEPRNSPAHSWGYQSTMKTRLTKQPNNIPPCSVKEPKFFSK